MIAAHLAASAGTETAAVSLQVATSFFSTNLHLALASQVALTEIASQVALSAGTEAVLVLQVAFSKQPVVVNYKTLL